MSRLTLHICEKCALLISRLAFETRGKKKGPQVLLVLLCCNKSAHTNLALVEGAQNVMEFRLGTVYDGTRPTSVIGDESIVSAWGCVGRLGGCSPFVGAMLAKQCTGNATKRSQAA